MKTRRSFFRQLIGYSHVLVEEFKGHPHYKISDLWKLDDQKFKLLKLKVRDEVQIHHKADRTIAIRDDGEEIELYRINTEFEFVFRLVQQNFTVGEISERLGEISERDGESRFQLTRAYLSKLIKQNVYIPSEMIRLD